MCNAVWCMTQFLDCHDDAAAWLSGGGEPHRHASRSPRRWRGGRLLFIRMIPHHHFLQVQRAQLHGWQDQGLRERRPFKSGGHAGPDEEPDVVSEYDQSCGTVGVGDYTRVVPGSAPRMHLFVRRATRRPRAFIRGVHAAVDCHMNYNMKSILANTDPIVTFIHQMIPHHQNAVNMAKALLKTNTLDATDEDDREMENMMWGHHQRPELPDPPDAGLSGGEELRGVGHLRSDAVDGANLRADTAPDALADCVSGQPDVSACARAHARTHCGHDAPPVALAAAPRSCRPPRHRRRAAPTRSRRRPRATSSRRSASSPLS